MRKFFNTKTLLRMARFDYPGQIRCKAEHNHADLESRLIYLCLQEQVR